MEKETSARSNGGKARAAKLSPEKRREIAMSAVKAKAELAKLPKATHFGTLKIGDIEIPCAVLEDGTRVFSESGVADALLGGRSGASIKLRRIAKEEGRAPLPVFLAPGQLKPFINNDLEQIALFPISFVINGKKSSGFEATVLPSACEAWLDARQSGALQKQQMDKAQKAEILMRGLARVGVIALVDEATGYQKDRARDALAKILEAYVVKEIQPWIKTFDSAYYENMFRLRGLQYPPEKANYRPGYFGHLTNDIVYSRLAPGVLSALKEEAKKDEKKGARLFQHLTAGFGRQELLKHLGMVVGLMRLSSTWPDFMSKLNVVATRYNESMALDLEELDR